MTLPSSGALSMNAVNTELGNTATAQLDLNNTNVRGMIGNTTSGSQISMSSLYGKNKAFTVTLTISANVQNYNIQTAAQAAGWNGTIPLNATVVINSGIYVGSSTTGGYALMTGTIPAGSTINIINNGYIIGCGGAGGACGVYYNKYRSAYNGVAGSAGGGAMYLTYAVTITNNAYIWGGGGGGGGGGVSYESGSESGGYYYSGSGGGGGQGWTGGAGGSNTQSGSVLNGTAGAAGGTTAAGAAGASSYGGTVSKGGAGGTVGVAGAAGYNGNGGWGNPGNTGGAAGAAGYAIVRNGYAITWAGSVGASTAYVKGTVT